MKIKKLFGNRSNAIKAFPISHISLLSISVLLIGKIEGSFDSQFVDKLIISLFFVLLLSCIGPLIKIHSNVVNNEKINLICQVLSLIIGVAYFFILPDKFGDLVYSQGLLYYGIFIIAGLLVVLTLGYCQRNEENRIRYSWMSLIKSVIIGGIAGSIVWGGIAGAFGSIEALFDVNIDSDRYGYVGVVSEILLAGSIMFNYYLILTEKLQESNFNIEPSRIRKIFGSFIFLPLAIIYLLIFLAYGVKILVTGIRPKGIIVWLGVGYFVLGIICMYINYPDKNRIHEIINKVLLISFVLISFMMIGAISQRIAQYGITINRWFVCAFIGVILVFSILSLIFTQRRLLMLISTIFVFSLVSLYGPLNANNISYNSQVKRLTNIVSQEGLNLPLQKGDLENVDGKVVTSILGILDELAYDYKKDKVVDKVISYDYKAAYRYGIHSEILAYLGGDEIEESKYPTYFYYREDKSKADGLDIEGFSKFYFFEESGEIKNLLKMNFDNQSYEVDLSLYIDELLEKSSLYSNNENRNQPALVVENDNYKVIVTGFNGKKDFSDDSVYIDSIEGYLLVK